MKPVSIHIGELHASRDPAIVETVLGSCIAACLFDPVHKVGGMNHFLLPKRCNDDPVLTRYGEYAMQALIERILKLGGQRKHLYAKVFGAASVLTLDETRISVPRANECFVREFLATERIALTAERLGGKQPMKVRMFTHNGTVLVQALPRTQLDGVVDNEGKLYSDALARRWGWFEEGAAL